MTETQKQNSEDEQLECYCKECGDMLAAQTEEMMLAKKIDHVSECHDGFFTYDDTGRC